jgi:hypothetical protein
VKNANGRPEQDASVIAPASRFIVRRSTHWSLSPAYAAAMARIDPTPPQASHAAVQHAARARHFATAARRDMLLGAAVAAAGFGEMVAALLFVRGHDLLGWLVRVQGLGLLGLLASVWGWALLDSAWSRLRIAHGVRRSIEAGQGGWAPALAGLEE